MNKKTFAYFVFFCLLLSVPLISLAGDYTVNGHNVHFEGLVPCGKAVASDGESDEVTDPCQLCHVFVMLNEILTFVITYIVPPIAVLLIAWGGAQMLLAGGNPGLFRTGVETIKWVAIGVAVTLGAWVLVNTFFTFIGVQEWTGLREGWFQINCGGFGMGEPPREPPPEPPPPEDEPDPDPLPCVDVCDIGQEVCIDEMPPRSYNSCFRQLGGVGDDCLEWWIVNCGPGRWCEQTTPEDANCVFGPEPCNCQNELRCASGDFMERSREQCLNDSWQINDSMRCPANQFCRGDACSAVCVMGEPCDQEGLERCNDETADPRDTLRCNSNLFWGTGTPCEDGTVCFSGPGGVGCLTE